MMFEFCNCPQPLMLFHTSNLDFFIALSHVPGATNTCYHALISPRRPRGRRLRAKQKSRSVA
jgi:hypothetical protein